ncbi:helicase-related protein [Sphingomonas sp. MMS12-HWE2-04]|uniref:helicase-related protein n=1 Tax=Sphingomonas sp. MMS12-HWE2-04 TaxID=3234199 RepID=UPI00384C3736
MTVPIGVVATALAEMLESGDVIFVASDEQRAEAVAAALQCAAPDAEVIHCPSSDALPGDSAPASPANVGRRVAALRRARQAALDGTRSIGFVTTAEAAAHPVSPPASFDAAPPAIAVGDILDVESFTVTLEEIGYFADDRVDEPGEMAVRGQVIDLFPADASLPARIELEEGRIVALRAYDPASQLGSEALDRLEIGRVSEPPLGDDWTSLFDHVPSAAIATDPDAEKRRDRFVALARDPAGSGRTMPVVDRAAWERAVSGRRMLDLGANTGDAPRFVEGKAPLRAFARAAATIFAEGGRVVVAGAARDIRFLSGRVAKALGRAPVPLPQWRDLDAIAPGTAALLGMPLDRGWTAPGLLVVAASDLLGSRALTSDTAHGGVDALRGQTGEIRLGDVVVHEQFGIGTVGGLEPMTGDGDDLGDAIVLEYAGGGRRLMPVGDADRLWRYGAEADAVTLDKLDGSSWEKRRGAIDLAIADSARGLTKLAAERDGRSAPVLEPEAAAYERFASGFPFTETPDQARAIAAVRDELASGKPMDRLVVGDVGYGKTEVALRAVALAALAGKQAIVAAPTTVLVRQHLDSFRQRFEGTDIVVAGLSRLSSPAERKTVKAGLADGSVHVVIGTGAVAGADYRDLALVVIDEEQRFGAADKAKLRGLSVACHILTLTATPIPRTLQTALVGLQQVSVIATPPARRQPIRTSIDGFDPATVRTALMREKSRGGQSFVVVSRIEDMSPMAERLAALVPDLRIAQAHGKMPAVEIDEAMVAFARGDGDVLLATNIIEAGLDVPRANTMIVWRAERFGLSQLHQLRGRVGRGSRRGQILLLTDPDAAIAEATLKRLRTLQAFDRLGAGFAISARDLDMRGAGDLLGDAQAGHMKLIGVDLYQHLLSAALRTARGETVDYWSPELHLGVAGRLPEKWIPEIDTRINLYARLARITEAARLDAFELEIEDRFGIAPEDARRLLTVARARMLARDIGIARIDAGPAAVALTPRAGATITTVGTPLEDRNGRLILAERIEDADERLERIRALLEEMASVGSD